MSQSETLNELATALAKAQAEFTAIPKDSNNPFFKSKYAGLPIVVSVASPILTKHGLSVSQFPSSDNGVDTLTTLLLHESGQFISHSMILHLPKQDPQGQGSALTYARRYAYMGALGLVADDDDDGNAASRGREASSYIAEAKQITTANRGAASAPKSGNLDKDERWTKIKECHDAGAGTEFIASLVEQGVSRGSLTDKQLSSGFNQAVKLLKEHPAKAEAKAATKAKIEEAFPGAKHDERPF